MWSRENAKKVHIVPSMHDSKEFYIFRNNLTEVKFRIVKRKIRSEKYSLTKKEINSVRKFFIKEFNLEIDTMYELKYPKKRIKS